MFKPDNDIPISMIFEEFISTSSPRDIATYIIIVLVIVALSPYGIFVLRSMIAAAKGQPPPRIVRRGANSIKSRDLDAISDLEQVATTHIREMSGHIAELQGNLADARCQVEQLQYENNALKVHIREMEAAPGPEQDNFGPTTNESNDNSDYAILGLPETRHDEIRAAFRKTTRNAHPDQGGDSERFREIVAAYDRLMEQK